MANNLLFLRNKTTGEVRLLAKSFGDGWSFRNEDSVQEWMGFNDYDDACCGNCFKKLEGTGTNLELITDNCTGYRWERIDDILHAFPIP